MHLNHIQHCHTCEVGSQIHLWIVCLFCSCVWHPKSPWCRCVRRLYTHTRTNCVYMCVHVRIYAARTVVSEAFLYRYLGPGIYFLGLWYFLLHSSTCLPPKIDFRPNLAMLKSFATVDGNIPYSPGTLTGF